MNNPINNHSSGTNSYYEIDTGNYLDDKQYLNSAMTLAISHCLLEIFYIWLSCTPMVFINIVSIIAYIISIILIKKGKTLVTVWIIVLEIYSHVVFASIFLGVYCGFLLWLFGTFSSLFLPFANPTLSKLQRRQIGIFGVIIMITFITLTITSFNNLLPTTYNVDRSLGKILYCINAGMGFAAIMLYTTLYNIQMSDKNNALRWAAEHDFLTRIYNRQRIQQILYNMVDEELAIDKEDLSIAILDIDYFKNTNDTYGHIAGDDVLKQIAGIFEQYVDKGLLFGRWGGEEFLLIAPKDMSFEEFGVLLEKIRKHIEAYPFTSGKTQLNITVSMGASRHEKGMKAQKLVHIADDRLYAAKNLGRNRIVME